MNYGLYLSATGVQSSLYRQDVLANNLANVQTTGFKPDLVFTRERLPERIESGSAVEPQWLLERLGGGHFVDPTRTSLGQASLEQTHNPLDLAIEGDGFFVLASGRGGDVRLTRDGRFTTNTAGELVLAANGLRVLDGNNQPIRLNGTGQVRVDGDGNLFQAEQLVARLGLVAADAEEVVKSGGNTFRLAGGDTAALKPATGAVRQGFLETSGVDPIKTLNELISASKNAQANATLMQYQDHIIGEAITRFGRVA